MFTIDDWYRTAAACMVAEDYAAGLRHMVERRKRNLEFDGRSPDAEARDREAIARGHALLAALAAWMQRGDPSDPASAAAQGAEAWERFMVEAGAASGGVAN